MDLLERLDMRDSVSLLQDPGDVCRLVDLFEQIAQEEGWHTGDQLRVYMRSSWHIGAIVGGRMAGGIQVAVPDTAGNLPYRAVWPEVEVVSRNGIAEVTILAVSKQFRKQHVFWSLCVELWRQCIAGGISSIVLEATPEMLERYRKVGWPLEVIGELREHMGELCYLCALDMRMVAGSIVEMAYRYPSFRSIVPELIRPHTARCRKVKAVA